MFAAAMLICVINIELMIFSVSLNSSRKMLQMIKDLIAIHFEGKEMSVEANNKDKYWIRGGENDRRMCESRPGRGSVSFFFRLARIVPSPPFFFLFLFLGR